MQPIKCHNCGKLLLEATGEGKKKCPKCHTMNHFIVTESLFGVIYIDASLADNEFLAKDPNTGQTTLYKMMSYPLKSNL